MPIGIYLHKKHTNKWKKNISNKLKKYYKTHPHHLIGKNPWNKDIKISKEYRKQCIKNLKGGMKGKQCLWKEKISIANKGKNVGKHFSPNTEFKKGMIPWNKGKNKYDYPQLRNSGTKTPIKGNKSILWRGGVTHLYNLIRELPENKKWIRQVFKRDNYICRECFKQGGYLHAHHNKKSFALILREFLNQYSQFSPIEDKETLTRLAITYEPFWDLDNGQTLCKKCHYTYDRKNIKNLIGFVRLAKGE